MAKKKKLVLLKEQPKIKRTGPKPKEGKFDVVLPTKKVKKVPAPSLILSPSEKKSRAALERIAKDHDALEEASLLENFPKTYLQLKAYDWQRKV